MGLVVPWCERIQESQVWASFPVRPRYPAGFLDRVVGVPIEFLENTTRGRWPGWPG